MGGLLGVVIAAMVGAVLAVVASVGAVTAVNQTPSPIDKPFIVYGSAGSTAGS